MPDDESTQQSSQTIPVVAEEAVLHKRQVETGRVRISKSVRTEHHEVSDSLRYEEAVIERVPCGAPVDPADPPQVREQGDVTIVPVLEEVLVVEKRLMLKEELHVRRVAREVRKSVPVSLQREEVNVERSGPGEPPPAGKG